MLIPKMNLSLHHNFYITKINIINHYEPLKNPKNPIMNKKLIGST
jgi:hypothetical protein